MASISAQWFPRVDVYEEDMLAKAEEAFDNEILAIRFAPAPTPIGVSGGKKDEEEEASDDDDNAETDNDDSNNREFDSDSSDTM